MTAPANPAATVLSVCKGVSRLAAGDLDANEREALLDELAALYAEETDVRHPFSYDNDAPLRTRSELREHFAAISEVPERIDRWEPVDFHAHQTTDPEVVIAEFRYAGSIEGRGFSLPCIFVTRVRNGEIVESRDYANHIARARAFGELGELAAALAAEA
jgi:ketosteroid isomerase-like protein